MIYTDSHTHTSFSMDAKENFGSDPESMIKAAIAKGLKTIAITDHQDWNDPYFDDLFKPEEYFKELGRLRDKYIRDIDVRLGVEIGLQEDLAPGLRCFTEASPYDIVIGSVHIVNGKDPYTGDFYEGKSAREAYAEAFQYTLDNLRTEADFDILGHIDYVVRYGNYSEDSYSYELFRDEIDAVLRAVIETGRGIELNTSGLKYGLGHPHPREEIIKRYKELGGEIITVGSDAHAPEHIAYDFDKAEEILRWAGFAYYADFKDRKPSFHRL